MGSSGNNLSQTLVDTMQNLFGGIRKHPGYRTTHAKGLLVEGKFTPSEQAKTLSVAAHFNNPSTPVIARFSVGGGMPHTEDTDENATPKGIAMRFQVDSNAHSDLIAHSFNGFATRTGEDFLSFLQLFGALKFSEAQLKSAQGDTSKLQESLKKAQQDFGAFLGSHPSAATFATSAKPNPFNYGTITYYEPNTHVLTNKDGKVTNIRYRLIPQDGDHLYTDPDQVKKLARDYLNDDLRQRFPQKPIVLTLQAHIADPGDVLDDATIPYKSTTLVNVGKLEFNKVMDNNAATQQQIAFSPTPDEGGIKGIAPSKDPLIQTRRGVYQISASQRRNDVQKE